MGGQRAETRGITGNVLVFEKQQADWKIDSHVGPEVPLPVKTGFQFLPSSSSGGSGSHGVHGFSSGVGTISAVFPVK